MFPPAGKGFIGPIVIQKGAPVTNRLTVLDRRANRLLDDFRLSGNGRVDLDIGPLSFDCKLSGRRTDDDITGRQPIATALAVPLGQQPLLFDQQGQAALQHARRQLEGQPLADGPDLHAGWMSRHDRENGLKLLFGDLLWHARYYMS